MRKLESFIIEKMSKTKLPSLAISIVKDGKVVYSRGFGFRDIDRGLAATPRTLYGIGSVTKSFTALAIMQLYEKGLLDLEDPVEKYAPVKLRALGEPVRIHHLLTHSSGIPALAYAEALIRGIIGEEDYWMPIASYEDMFSFLSEASDWAVAKPGEKFFYLNEGYVLLGYIVEKVSGMKYEEYVKKNILAPLKMERTVFIGEDMQKLGDVAVPYAIGKEEFAESRYPPGITADGGLISCVEDLSRYLAMYLNKGELDGVRVISPESIEKMTEPYIPVPWTIFGGEAYGYGWMICPSFFGRKLVAHGGSVLVSTAYVGFIPEEKIGVALLANGSGYSLSYIGMYALALLLGKDPEEDLPFIKADRLLDKLEGIYETYKGTMRVSVVRKEAILYLERKGKYTAMSLPMILEKIEDDRAIFKVPGLATHLTAEFVFKNGRIELYYERYKFVKKQ